MAVRLSVGSGHGVLPRMTPAFALLGSLELQRLRFELGGAYWLSGEARYGNPPTVGARIDLLTALVRACPVAELWSLEMPLCLSVEAGAMRGRGFGTSEARASTRARFAVGLGPALVVPVEGRLRLLAQVDALWVLMRPAFRVRNLERLYLADRVALQGFLGVEAALD